MALTFYLLDENFDVFEILENYKSAIWTGRYSKSGDFELYLPATKALIDAVNIGNGITKRYICRGDEPSKCGIVERVAITTDVENGNFLTIAGRTIESMIFKRIVKRQTTYTGSPKEIIYRLVTNSLIDPDLPIRAVEGLKIERSELSTDDIIITQQFDGANVGEAIEGLCQAYRIGYKITFDITNKEFIFKLYEGTDRSTNQSEVPPVVFSNDFNNLISSNYGVDIANKKDLALVAGEGEGTARKKVEVGAMGQGLLMSEMYINAQTISTNDGEMTETTYRKALTQQGYNALLDNSITTAADGEVAPNYGFILNQDYFLGDIVSIENEYGVKMAPRVVEIIEAQDETGYSIIPTFAND